MINQKPCPKNPELRQPPEVIEKKIYTYAESITWANCASVGISNAIMESAFPETVCETFLRVMVNGMNRLPKNTRKRAVTTHRYENRPRGTRFKWM